VAFLIPNAQPSSPTTDRCELLSQPRILLLELLVLLAQGQHLLLQASFVPHVLLLPLECHQGAVVTQVPQLLRDGVTILQPATAPAAAAVTAQGFDVVGGSFEVLITDILIRSGLC